MAVGTDSRAYLQALGATNIISLPNVTDAAIRDRRPARTGNSGDHQSIVLCHVGDWSIRKGAIEASEMYDQLRHSLERSGTIIYLIAGNVVDAELPAGATYLGYLPHDELWAALRQRAPDFMVLLSTSDHWAFVVPEAISQGVLPVVSTNVGCAADLLSRAYPPSVVSSGAEAAGVILALHQDGDEYRRALTAMQTVLRARTSRWAANTFESGLRELTLAADGHPSDMAGRSGPGATDERTLRRTPSS